MYLIYTAQGQQQTSNTKQVVQLLRQYPFDEENNFFTIERAGLDLLEIIFTENGFRLGYIPQGAEEAQYLPAHYDKLEVERAAAAFCEGFLEWMDIESESEAADVDSAAPITLASHPEEKGPLYDIPPRSLHPKGCGSILILLVVFTVLIGTL